jgi:hypothetical protein
MSDVALGPLTTSMVRHGKYCARISRVEGGAGKGADRVGLPVIWQSQEGRRKSRGMKRRGAEEEEGAASSEVFGSKCSSQARHLVNQQ